MSWRIAIPRNDGGPAVIADPESVPSFLVAPVDDHQPLVEGVVQFGMLTHLAGDTQILPPHRDGQLGGGSVGEVLVSIRRGDAVSPLGMEDFGGDHYVSPQGAGLVAQRTGVGKRLASFGWHLYVGARQAEDILALPQKERCGPVDLCGRHVSADAGAAVSLLVDYQ